MKLLPVEARQSDTPKSEFERNALPRTSLFQDASSTRPAPFLALTLPVTVTPVESASMMPVPALPLNRLRWTATLVE